MKPNKHKSFAANFFAFDPLSPYERAVVVTMLAFGFLGRLVLAAIFPLTNDEAYYWDWGQAVKLSYFDHPPGVSYLTFFSARWATAMASLFALGPDDGLGVLKTRLLSPLLHFFGGIFLIKSFLFIAAEQNTAQGSHSSTVDRGGGRAVDPYGGALGLALLLVIVPGFGLLGSLALPDIGLFAASSVVLYGALVLVKRDVLGFWAGVGYGVAVGCAGLFKYHAVLLCGGMSLALAVSRAERALLPLPRSLFKDLVFWSAAVSSGFIVCMPVWIWNLQNGGASILFQLDHGFGGPRLSLLTGLRLILAQVFILGPAFFWVACRDSREALLSSGGVVSHYERIVIWAALPLFLVVVGASFFKEMMPHWLLPGWILLLPLVACKGADSGGGKTNKLTAPFAKNSPAKTRPSAWALWYLWPTVVYSALLLFSLPWVKERLLVRLGGNPGPLSELTVWAPLAEEVATLKTSRQFSQQQTHGNASLPPSQAQASASPPLSSAPIDVAGKPCPAAGLFGGMRWYSVAQLRFHLPANPKVLSLDPNHNSYYRDRDEGAWPRGCPIWVVALKSTLDLEKLKTALDIQEIHDLKVRRHERQPWAVYMGVLR